MDLFANYVEFAKFCQLNKVIHNKTDRMDSTKMENSQWLAGIKRFFVALSSATLAPCWGSG